MRLRIHRQAVAEIDHEVDYYESRQTGLGAELEDEIEAVFALIMKFPEAAPQWKQRRDRRVAVLDRFPFTLPYQIFATRSSFSRSRTRAGGQVTGLGDGERRVCEPDGASRSQSIETTLRYIHSDRAQKRDAIDALRLSRAVSSR